MAAATRVDPELAARIVRTIKQIEDDHFLASGPFSERLMRDAVQAIEKVAIAPWQVVETDWTVQIVCPEWKMTKGVGTGDAWLELTEVCSDEDRDYCWISAAVGAGPTRMGLELVFRRGLQEFAQTAIRNDKLIAVLLKLGMSRDETDARLFFLTNIPAEALAQGFEMNDLDKALAPVGEAMKKAITAKAELDKLVEHIRGAAKRK
jgi:hypothetical protein